MKVVLGRTYRRNNYSFDFWFPRIREAYTLRSLAKAGGIISMSNNATVQVATRLEPKEFVFELPKVKIVNRITINGYEQPEKKRFLEFIEENGGKIPDYVYAVWYQIPGRLYIEYIRAVPTDYRLEVFTGGR